MNHTRVSTTAIYARLNLDPVREALEHNAALMFSTSIVQQTSSEAPERSARWPKTPATIAAPVPSQTLSRGWLELSRNELYEKIWSQPARSLAEEFGISDRGLGKICARFEIPVPPRGYWQKLSAGQRVVRTPLPALKSKVSSKIQIQPTATRTNATASLATS